MTSTSNTATTEAFAKIAEISDSIIKIVDTTADQEQNLFFVERSSAEKALDKMDTLFSIETARQVHMSQDLSDDLAVSISAQLVQAHHAFLRQVNLLGDKAFADTIKNTKSITASGNFRHLALVSVNGKSFDSEAEEGTGASSPIRVDITRDETGMHLPLTMLSSLITVGVSRAFQILRERYFINPLTAIKIASIVGESITVELARSLRESEADADTILDFVIECTTPTPRLALMTLCRGEIGLSESILAVISGLTEQEVVYAAERCGRNGIDAIFSRTAHSQAYVPVFAAAFDYAADLLEPETREERVEFIQAITALVTAACADADVDEQVSA